MKRLSTILLALMLLSLSAFSVFAASDDNYNYVTWADNSTLQAPKITLKDGQIVLGMKVDGANVVVLPETYLKPGNEYEYGLFLVSGNYQSVAPDQVNLVPVTKAMVGKGTIKARPAEGSAAISVHDIKARTDGFVIKLEPKETFGTKLTDVKLRFLITGDVNPAFKPLESAVYFTSGYREIDESRISGYGEDDYLFIDNNRPVITKDMFDELADNANGKPVKISDDNQVWEFAVRTRSMKDTNFTTSNKVIEEIAEKYYENNFKFLTFGAGIQFPISGEMRIDVSDIIEDDTKNVSAYLYRDSTLIPINSTFDTETDEVLFRTNYLGAFVISDFEINDRDLTEEVPGEDDEDTGKVTDNGHGNPSTGKLDISGAIISLGMASILAALYLKRRSRI